MPCDTNVMVVPWIADPSDGSEIQEAFLMSRVVSGSYSFLVEFFIVIVIIVLIAVFAEPRTAL